MQMDATTLIVSFTLGAAIGAALGALITHLYASSKLAQLEAQKVADAEKLDWVKRAQQDMQKIFGALAFKSIKKNGEFFATQIHQQLKHHADHIGGIRTSFETSLAHLDQRIKK